MRACVCRAGFENPPRPEVRQAIASCQKAGIRPIMITGDHPFTTWAIAKQIGLDEAETVLTGQDLDAMSDEALSQTLLTTSLYARTTPQHKLRIVKNLHRRGEIVAVTGDGINDAPALAAADIGVAMGETGSEVARASADIVLADDNFATIIRAVEEGRISYENLKMELFMDLAASATFVAEPAEKGLMQQPPRCPKAKLMDRPMLACIFSSAVGLFAAVSVSYLATWYRTHDLTEAQTMAFAAWLVGHIFLALNLRSEREPLVRLGYFSNHLMVIWATATLALLLFATLVPAVQGLFRVVPLSPTEWLLAAGATMIGTFWIEAKKVLGGYLTYRLAEKGGQEILERKVGKPRAEKIYKRFERHGVITVFTGSILPPPFPFTYILMVAGVMQYPRKKFFSALTAGRAVRLFAVAYLGRIYGQRMISFFSQHYQPVLYVLIPLAVTAGIGALVYFKWYRSAAHR
ncbi:MAG: HAD-IC family P-type ATPase [Acidobacteriota bacterium]